MVTIFGWDVFLERYKRGPLPVTASAISQAHRVLAKPCTSSIAGAPACHSKLSTCRVARFVGGLSLIAPDMAIEADVVLDHDVENRTRGPLALAGLYSGATPQT